MTLEKYLQENLPPAQNWACAEFTLTTSEILQQLSKAMGEPRDWKELIQTLEQSNYKSEVLGGETYWLIAKS